MDDAQKVSFVFLPEGEDPDSLVKKSGAPAFEEMLKKALPLSSYLIEALSQGLDLAVLEDRNAFIEEASPLVRKTKSPLLRDGLIERLSTAVGYKTNSVNISVFLCCRRRLLRDPAALAISDTASEEATTGIRRRGFRRRPDEVFLRRQTPL